jgi:hypothetical protein
MLNAHLHLDRAGTLDTAYMEGVGYSVLETSHISLHAKHGLIGTLHDGPAFEREDMMRRVNACLDVMVSVNTVRADTMVDVTADGVGLSALEILEEIKHARADEIDLQLGAYSPLGFKDSEPERWELMVEGAERADFIGCLPEADDVHDYPDHIGFYEHCRRFLELSKGLNKLLHVHTDQRNEPSEDGTEQLIQAVSEFGAPRAPDGQPMVWAVHMISPSTYDDGRFEKLLTGLVSNNIGVICCPSAALGMRQLRPLQSPTANSIPRVLELIAGGAHVRLGSDNIADLLSPSTTPDLLDEIFVLTAALRFYHPDVLARLAAGQPLSDAERTLVQEHLRENDLEIDNMLRGQRT